MTAASPIKPPARPLRTASPARWRLRRRHALMLALAAEILVLGAHGAERYRPPAIDVEETLTPGHRIT